VVGIALKDRGSILPAGHTGTAYWYEGLNGNWVSSTYYMNELPKWVNDFNAKRWVDTFSQRNWNTLYPIDTYAQSDKDDMPYEAVSGLDKKPVFPHITAPLVGRNYSIVRATPWGNTLTLDFAKTALQAEELGKDDITDLLAISLSSPDYIGHQYGPNSIEIEDTYLRLDKELEAFFKFLDEKVGKDEYLFFITADHAVAHVPAFLKANKIDVRTVPSDEAAIEAKVFEKFKVPDAIETAGSYQVYLNHRTIDSVGASTKEIGAFIVSELRKLPHVLNAFSYDDIATTILPVGLKELYVKGYNPKLSGDIQIIIKSGFFYGGATGTTHGSWNPYDSHIPSAFMGWGIKPGKTNKTTYMTDISATLAALLRIQMPSGCVGTPIEELMK
jgi:Type I phosphodiesterase / nucleotide pyrophosphatase